MDTIHTLRPLAALTAALLAAPALWAQQIEYTYTLEDFEANIWQEQSQDDIEANTGKWKLNGNYAVAGKSYQGAAGLAFRRSLEGVTLPPLTNGAGTLIVYCMGTNNAKLVVETSEDGETFAQAAEKSVSVEWTKYVLRINNAKVKRVRLKASALDNLWLDNLVLTHLDGSDGEGNQLAVPTYPAYYTLDYEYDTGNSDAYAVLIAKKTDFKADEWAVEGDPHTPGSAANPLVWEPTEGLEDKYPAGYQNYSGWAYYCAYKNSNADKIPDKSRISIQLLKHDSDNNPDKQPAYMISPYLSNGVAQIIYDCGRGMWNADGTPITTTDSEGNVTQVNRKFDIYVTHSLSRQLSQLTDDDWILKVEDHENVLGIATNVIEINDDAATRIKIVNKGTDESIDNLTITCNAHGTAATVTTGAASSITSMDAVVAGTMTEPGDADFREAGFLWTAADKSKDGATPDPSFSDNVVRVTETPEIGEEFNFTYKLVDIPSNDTIYYAAFVTTLAGTVVGDTRSFVTPAARVATISLTPPEADNSKSDGSKVAVRLQLDVDDNGGAKLTRLGVCWSDKGTDPVLDQYYNYPHVEVDAKSERLDVTLPFEPEKEFRFMGYAINKAGKSQSVVVTATFKKPEVSTPEDYPDAKTYYVSEKAPKTDADCDGSEAAPFYHLQKAIDLARPGDQIIADGDFNYNETLRLTTNGEQGAGNITIKAAKTRTYFYFEGLPEGANGLEVSGCYWHLYRLSFCQAPGYAMLVRRGVWQNKLDANGENVLDDNQQLVKEWKPMDWAALAAEEIAATSGHDNTFDLCEFKDSKLGGAKICKLATGNRFINCDACYNMEIVTDVKGVVVDVPKKSTGFELSDGFGPDNYFYGCRAFQNGDAGWDFNYDTKGAAYKDLDLAQQDMPTTTLEYCLSMRNGYLKEYATEKVTRETDNGSIPVDRWTFTPVASSAKEGGDYGSAGPGVGFRLGSSQGACRVVCNRCLAFDNRKQCFFSNNALGDIILNNCTAYGEKDAENLDKQHATFNFTQKPNEGQTLRLTNCYTISDGNGNPDKSPYAIYNIRREVEQVCTNLQVSPDYVKSIDFVDAQGLFLNRKNSGQLPYNDFLRLQDAKKCPGGTNALVDAGEKVYRVVGEVWNSASVSYLGDKPDVGWMELGKRNVDLNPPMPKAMPGVMEDPDYDPDAEVTPDPKPGSGEGGGEGGEQGGDKALDVHEFDATLSLQVRSAGGGQVSVTVGGAQAHETHTVRVVALSGVAVAQADFNGAQGVVRGLKPGFYIVQVPGVGSRTALVR